MNDIMIKEDVSSMIIKMRDTYVIVDRDIARILGIETRVLNQSVRRNINMFNKINYFQLDENEFTDWKSQNNALISQNVISKGGVRKLPYVFTKEEILILTSILKVKNELIIELINAFDRQNLVIQNDDDIREMIYEIRGKQVMFDYDLAYLYECKNGTKEINQAVKNNIEKFPKRFSWILTNDESRDFLVKNFDQKNIDKRGGRYKNPRVFTEQGVIMLATVLKSDVATKISISIMDAFVSMKRYISYVSLEQKYINNLVLEDHSKINKLEKAFDEFKEKEVITEVYFDGQIYDAYSKILSLFKGAKERLIVIDSYADEKVLNIIKDVNIDVILITTNIHMEEELVNIYNEQYHNLKLIYDNTFHDRYFIIDNTIYHCGSSINRIGYKTFSITKISDDITNNAIMDKVDSIIEGMII